MKYLRTKDNNIWKVLKEDSISFIVDDTHTPPPFDVYTVLKTEVVKQIDTIEELFDEFVIIGSNEYLKYIKHSLKEALQKQEWLKRKGYDSNIYGAIWTDEGLIYKAKLKGVLFNDKVDWELL